MSDENKKEVKVEDLKPAKDAKGGAGGAHTNSGGSANSGAGLNKGGSNLGGMGGKQH